MNIAVAVAIVAGLVAMIIGAVTNGGWLYWFIGAGHLVAALLFAVDGWQKRRRSKPSEGSD